jgi:hypothetical protein
MSSASYEIYKLTVSFFEYATRSKSEGVMKPMEHCVWAVAG